MDGSVLAATAVFILSVCLLLISVQTSFALEKPAQSATIALVVAGLCLLLGDRFASGICGHIEAGRCNSDTLPLTSKCDSVSTRHGEGSEKQRKHDTSAQRPLWPILVFATSALVLRVDIWRRLADRTNCDIWSGWALAPFLIWLYDDLRNSYPNNGDGFRHRPAALSLLPTNMLPQVLLLIASLGVSILRESWKSTVICPQVGKELGKTLGLQVSSAFLDAGIFISFGKICAYRGYRLRGRPWGTPGLWSIPLLGAAAVWIHVGLVLIVHPFGFPPWTPAFSYTYISSVQRESCLFAALVLSASKAIAQVRPLSLSFMTSFAIIYRILLSGTFHSGRSFLVTIVLEGYLVVLSLHGAGYTYLRESLSIQRQRQKKKSFPLFTWLRWLLLFSFVYSFLAVTFHDKGRRSHPIDNIIADAQRAHQEWLLQARRSSNLKEAVGQYQKRYNQNPPPGFDTWYKYATNRSSVIIDDFDQIYRDLLPFRAFEPRELRRLTSSMAGNPWDEIAAVVVRNGVAEPQPDILPTHRWMIEGVVAMIKPFAAHLPDMDIPFNLNDECRVAVPWEDIQRLKRISDPLLSSSSAVSISDQWSRNRASSWPRNVPVHQDEDSEFENLSFRKNFDLARSSCPPSSKARKEYIWDTRLHCTSCAELHSRDQFVHDSALSRDVCHQPDISFLHGFFAGPASFKVSRSLLPVFSQAKVGGFNDILYPSAWNYINKARYEPSDEHPDVPYSEKASTLFWRGSTSEGSSSGDGTWTGLIRQRLVHLANNDSTSIPHSILLQDTNKEKHKNHSTTYSHHHIPPTDLGLHTSIHLTDPITRCSPPDCTKQAAELRPANSVSTHTPFQHHWAYRFLFDTDGAGFSGRFLPFLQSRSLPFRTGLFSQWLDDRVAAWVHYVPLDLRLHGLWATLAYFAGASSPSTTAKGERLERMAPHDAEGEHIASDGRRWAATALRKEDMEIYMFRLLLEWGRLTDDRRDELGFTVD